MDLLSLLIWGCSLIRLWTTFRKEFHFFVSPFAVTLSPFFFSVCSCEQMPLLPYGHFGSSCFHFYLKTDCFLVFFDMFVDR